MGIYDRDYMAESGKGAGFRSWSMVTWLLVVNVTVYFLQHFIFDNQIRPLVNLSKETLFSGEVWRLVTFQFCHSDVGHLVSNMLGLFFLGRMFEQVVGSKLVLPVYLLGGVIGGLAHVFWGMAFASSSLIGASASVLAIVMALVATIPEQSISLLFLPFQFKIKYFGWAMLVYNLLGLLIAFSSPSNISYISHLGGMAAGWFFVKSLLPALNARESQGKTGVANKKRRSKIAEAAEVQIKKTRDQDTVYLNKKVDAILEKISQEGMQSLTDEERKVLERSSEKLSRKLDEK